MIDLDKAKNAFNNYSNQFDKGIDEIEYRYGHTLRVSELCGKIAESLKLDDESIAFAKLLGILHDVGRFKQIQLYHNTRDIQTTDHGTLGSKILFDNMLIRDFIENDKYDDMIRKVVYAHNKATVPETYNDLEKLYCNIVRDADIIDILHSTSNRVINKDIKDEPLSDNILNGIKNDHFIYRENVKTKTDALVLDLMLVYDLCFTYSLEKVYEGNYINKTIDSLDFKDKNLISTFNIIKNKINNYLDLKRR